MRNGLRQSMAWLHAWSGLVVGWVLFAVFVTGTASYYRPEISRWMRPELSEASTPLDAVALGRAADLARAHLEAHAEGARSWFIALPTPDHPVVDAIWRTKPGAPPEWATLDPATGAPMPVRQTRGGDFFYRFHFELSMPPLWGRWIVGICAMAMLVALLSGIVTHRRIFSDFFTFRRGAKSLQRSWLDAHNVTGVLALPFHLMITYTGLVTLALLYMPWGVTVAYQGDAQRFYAESGQVTAARQPAKRPAPLAPFAPMVEQALATNAETLERLTVQNPGDANAVVVAVFEEPHGLMHRHPQIAFDGTTGAVIETTGVMKPAAGTFATMVGLHEAHFAGTALRLIFFLCGIMGCAMVGTGLVLWSVARVPKPGMQVGFGQHLVDGLNIGTIAGLPAAVAAFFLANRLLPVGLTERAEIEVKIFFAAWIGVALYALLRDKGRAWRECFFAGAVLFLGVAIGDLLTTGEVPLFGTPTASGPFPGFDTVMLALGACLAYAGYKVRPRAAQTRAKELRLQPAHGLPRR